MKYIDYKDLNKFELLQIVRLLGELNQETKYNLKILKVLNSGNKIKLTLIRRLELLEIIIKKEFTKIKEILKDDKDIEHFLFYF